MTEENRRIALDLLHALTSGDTARVRELMAEDAEWWVLGGETRQREALIEATSIMASARKKELTILGTTAEANRVAVEAEGDFVFADGTSYQNRYHTLFIIEDGQVRTGREYLDTAVVERVFGGGEPQP